MKNTVSLLLPILFPMLCGILVGLLPALKDESKRRTFVLSSLILTFLFTLRICSAWRIVRISPAAWSISSLTTI